MQTTVFRGILYTLRVLHTDIPYTCKYDVLIRSNVNIGHCTGQNLHFDIKEIPFA